MNECTDQTVQWISTQYNWIGTSLDQLLSHVANSDCICGHIYIDHGARPLGCPTGLRPWTSPICLVYSGCRRDRDVLRPGRSPLCGRYATPRQLSGFGCGNVIATGLPFHRSSPFLDGTQKSILMLVHSFICNMIDYCNSVLYGASRFQLARLQSILNAAARFILRIPKFSHISASIRSELHWLSVRSRPEFKICLFV